MGSLIKGVGKAVKKVAKPEIIIPLALLAATGGTSALAGKGALLGKAGSAATAGSGIAGKLASGAMMGGPMATVGG